MMRQAILGIGFILTGGGLAGAYLGARLRRDKKRAQAASTKVKADVENARARRTLRRDWANEHEVISDSFFVGNTHQPQVIGGIEVFCPKCKEL